MRKAKTDYNIQQWRELQIFDVTWTAPTFRQALVNN